MDDFYQILDLLYHFNRKYPEIRFGQLMHNLMTRDDKIFYISNAEIIDRLKIFLKNMDE